MGSITDINGIRLGHETDEKNHTGTTVLVFDRPMSCGVDVRGGAPGTRETDVFSPLNLVETADAVVLSGGSAFGLDTASGVMKWLREQDRGMDTGYGKVPLVPGAVIFDLPTSSGGVRPDADMGYRAAKKAVAGEVPMGNVGAGAGATVGKLYGMEYAVKSGVGTASVAGAGGVVAVPGRTHAGSQMVDDYEVCGRRCGQRRGTASLPGCGGLGCFRGLCPASVGVEGAFELVHVQGEDVYLSAVHVGSARIGPLGR